MKIEKRVMNKKRLVRVDRSFYFISYKDGGIEDTIFIAKFGYALMPMGNCPNRSGSGAKALVLG